MYVLHGSKKIVVWPPDFFVESGLEILADSRLRKTIKDYDFGAVVDAGVSLEGGPGTLLYWPSSYWHVGVSTGDELTAVVNVGVFFAEAHSSTIMALVNRLARQALSGYDEPKTYCLAQVNGDGIVLSDQEILPLHRMRKLLASTVVEEALGDAWLKRMSAGGFREEPEPRPQPILTERSLVQVDSAFPLRWRATRGGIVVFANGHSFSLSGHEQVVSILEGLNSGYPVTVTELESSNREEDEWCRQSIAQLISVHAAELVESI